jgi:hypothetical protein
LRIAQIAGLTPDLILVLEHQMRREDRRVIDRHSKRKSKTGGVSKKNDLRARERMYEDRENGSSY